MKALLLALVFVACSPAPTPVEPKVGVDAAPEPCAAACETLKFVGCPEGASPNCVRACAKQSALERTPVACWAAAHSRDEARACGQLRCIPY